MDISICSFYGIALNREEAVRRYNDFGKPDIDGLLCLGIDADDIYYCLRAKSHPYCAAATHGNANSLVNPAYIYVVSTCHYADSSILELNIGTPLDIWDDYLKDYCRALDIEYRQPKWYTSAYVET